MSGVQNVCLTKLHRFLFPAERMCAERVEQVRAEYDQILQQKLSEQVCDHGLGFQVKYLPSDIVSCQSYNFMYWTNSKVTRFAHSI